MEENEINQLVKLCKEGDNSSFSKLVGLFAGLVSNIIYKMIGSSSEVDDIAQEVFIKIYQHIKYFREEAKFSSWIYRITMNTTVDYIRKKKHRKAVPLTEIEPFYSNGRNPTAGLEDSELKKILDQFIQEIPIKYRTVLILKDIEGLSYKEIADIINSRIGTVESRLFRARQILKEKLKNTKLWGELL